MAYALSRPSIATAEEPTAKRASCYNTEGRALFPHGRLSLVSSPASTVTCAAPPPQCTEPLPFQSSESIHPSKEPPPKNHPDYPNLGLGLLPSSALTLQPGWVLEQSRAGREFVQGERIVASAKSPDFCCCRCKRWTVDTEGRQA